ncbi:MAG: ferredoxin family protein [Planctomycetota bacterium]
MNPCNVIISRTAASDPEKHDFEDKLADQCAANGLRTLVVPDIYPASPSANAVLAIRQIEGPILLFSWLQPRAAFWTLRQFGVKGERAEVLPAGPFHPDKRPILCYRLSDRCCPGRWVEKIEELLGGRLPGGRGAIDRIEETVADRWYPVIDYSRCANCQECLEFCLFGVYEMDKGGRVVAAVPDACKPGCPACSRVCPKQAIIFPLHETDEAIAGSDTAKIEPFDPSTLDQLKHDYQEGKAGVRDVLRACGCKTKLIPQEERPCCSGGADEEQSAEDSDRGYFDKLIDGLVKD